MNNKYILSRCKCIVSMLVLSMANAVLADNVNISVPEGKDVTLKEAIENGYAGSYDYEALLKAEGLVVSGPGRLIIDEDIKTAGFAGEIRVKPGSTLRVTISGALGDTKKGTFVEAGATLETFTSGGANTLSFRGEPLTFAGAGVNGGGAIVALSTNGNQRGGSWGGTVLTMSGDAMIRVGTGKMADFPVQSPNASETIDMNGFTLTLCGPGTTSYSTLPVRMNVIDPGHIVVSNKLNISMNHQNNLGGTAENTFTIGQTAKLDLYNSNADGKNWTLQISDEAPNNPIVSSAGGVWNGPIVRQNSEKVFLAMATDDLNGARGNKTIFNDKVDLAGDLEVTNNTKLANRDYPRPVLSMNGEGNKIVGTMNLMEVDAEIGETDPDIGSVKLNKATLSLKNKTHSLDEFGNAGLWKGTKFFSEWSDAMTFFKGTECITSSGALGPDDAMTNTAQNHGKHTVVTYSGYIWNNDYQSSSRVITFVNNAKTVSDIYVTQSNTLTKLSVKDYQGDGQTVTTGMRLVPGAHKIEIRISMHNGTGGANGSFSSDYGIMYKWGSSTSTSTDPDDYLPLMDPGDGSLFTRTIPGSDEYEALGFGGNALLSPTASISGDGDSLLSLSGRYSVDSVEGPFYISNKKLPLCMDTLFSIGMRMICNASDIIAGRHLVVTGALDFAEGAVVSIEPKVKDFPAGEGYVLAESTEPITGLPTLETPTGPREITITVSEDRKKLLMGVKVYGTIISVR